MQSCYTGYYCLRHHHPHPVLLTPHPNSLPFSLSLFLTLCLSPSPFIPQMRVLWLLSTLFLSFSARAVVSAPLGHTSCLLFVFCFVLFPVSVDFFSFWWREWSVVLKHFFPVCNYSITVEVNERVTVPTHTHVNPLEPETGNALGSIGTNESVGLHYLTRCPLSLRLDFFLMPSLGSRWIL